MRFLLAPGLCAALLLAACTVRDAALPGDTAPGGVEPPCEVLIEPGTETYAQLADPSGRIETGPLLVAVPWEDLPVENDSALLVTAIDHQLRFLARGDSTGSVTFGGRPGAISRGRLIATLLALRREANRPDWGTPASRARLRERFTLLLSRGESIEPGFIHFTGYYVPVLEASAVRTETCPWPLYRQPALTRRWRRRGMPTHRDIDRGALAGKGLEVAWVSDRLDRFFLMIQGSGVLVYPDGTRKYARFAGDNNRPYRAVGRFMVEDGLMAREEMSMQRIESYLRAHPREADKYLYKCEAFSFFRIDNVPPVGAGVTVTANTSIAVDPRCYGIGLVGIADYDRPTAAPDSGPAPTRRAVHVVLAQDVGGAIKGPARVDIFTGQGEEAEIAAGHLNHIGRLFLLVNKAP